MPHTEVNGARLFFELTGTDGLALVFVHGSWVDHHNWDAVVPLLDGFQVLTYDRRGHGESERTAPSADLDQDARDLLALVNSLRLTHCHLVGNSFGALVALRAATLRPDLWWSLLLHEPPAFGILVETEGDRIWRAEVEAGLDEVRELLRSGRWEEGARLFLESNALGDGEWDRMPQSARETWVANAPAFLDQIANLDWATPDRSALAYLPMRVLLSKGNRSPAWQQRVVSLLAPGGLVTVGGAGHAPQLTHPEAYANLLTLFVESVTQPAATPE